MVSLLVALSLAVQQPPPPPPQDTTKRDSLPLKMARTVSFETSEGTWISLDVSPDGAAYNLMTPGLDAIRASYRDLAKGRQLLVPGRVYELALNNLVTSNLFQHGHRIRIQISTSFFPNFSRNLHTGELETVSSRMQRATIRVHHDREHPSQITLPTADR